MEQPRKTIDEIIMGRLSNEGCTFGSMEYDYELVVLYYPRCSELTLFANNKPIKHFEGILSHTNAYEYNHPNVRFILVMDSKLNNDWL
jgi:hypothetical protein